jgi:hypothetical protein
MKMHQEKKLKKNCHTVFGLDVADGLVDNAYIDIAKM